MNDFFEEYKDELKEYDFISKKKLEYEFNRWKAGLGKRLKLSVDEIITLHCIKEKARKNREE
nr:MAG TPA: hypothetical protein [Caudoviricetes sp.]DAS40943.1 MAG TPA: hypothetical protein [Caudoviricetes sp.]